MAAYLIVNIAVHDDKTYAEYRAGVNESVRAAGGEYLVRGGHVDVLEGDWRPERVVVIRFPAVDAAKSWWGSSAYSELKRMRQAAAVTQMILVEGMEGET